LQGRHCDLLISDVALPAMDGVALARQVLAGQPNIPIILTSGYERRTIGDTAKVANALFLTKPYGQAELLDAIARVMAGKSAAP
jgi:two-component system cell cycle sensor histidine kinase/response regulator CckA